MNNWRMIDVGIVILFLFLSLSAGIGFFLFTVPWIDFAQFERYDPGSPTILLDDSGAEWGRFELDRRHPVNLISLPHHVSEAFLSAEDWYFYDHYGISWKGIVRSLLVNLYYRKRVQGASTITQQLVKLLFFDLKKTFSRKIKEQLYATIIEQQFSKQQILEIYLNHVYFGCGIYGVEAAAQRFWGVPAAELTVSQAATLAGIIKNPAAYCPLLQLEQSEKRRNLVLSRMRRREVICQEQYERALAESLTVAEYVNRVFAPYLKEYIRAFLEERMSKKDLYAGGLTVQTTLNRTIQKVAEQEFEKQVRHLRDELKKKVDGGLLSCEVQTGKIKAIIGGLDFKQSAFNRAFQARRQLGSIFKPVVYAAALERGMLFTDVEVDEPIEVVQDNTHWTPHNFNHEYNGAITRAYALSRSNNMVTVKTLLATGIAPVIAMAERYHLSGPFNPYPSLALGCADATLKEATALISTFANGGRYVEPYCIEWVKDNAGKKIYKASPQQERVISGRIANQVAKVLMLSLHRVHKWFSHQWFKGEALSKTGTTNDSRTCWYIGSTPSIATGVYIGCDDNRSLGKNVYPVHTAFPIWLGITRATSTDAVFTFDPSLQTICIDECSGKRISADREGAIEILG